MERDYRSDCVQVYSVRAVSTPPERRRCLVFEEIVLSGNRTKGSACGSTPRSVMLKLLYVNHRGRL